MITEIIFLFKDLVRKCARKFIGCAMSVEAAPNTETVSGLFHICDVFHLYGSQDDVAIRVRDQTSTVFRNKSFFSHRMPFQDIAIQERFLTCVANLRFLISLCMTALPHKINKVNELQCNFTILKIEDSLCREMSKI